MCDEKRRGETDKWIPSIIDLLDHDIAMTPLNLEPTDNRDLTDVDLDRLCESILGNLKTPPA